MNQLTLNPREVVEYVVELGNEKTDKKAWLLAMQGIMAGAFIAFGGIAFLNIYANVSDPGLGLLLAAAIFPIGIMAILLMGLELVTSNTMIFVGVFKKSCKVKKALRMLIIVWAANLLGALAIAFLAKGANVISPHMTKAIHSIGSAKAGLTITEMILRGILCNMLVCGGVLMALSGKDNISKMAAIWLPIVVFILCQAEHIVANMFFLPMAYITGADISILDIIYNFFFVSVGNFIGGAIIISGYSYMTQLKN
ncbi:MAG: formate/nitrite transporter family protein [Eubacteriales bacterium]